MKVTPSAPPTEVKVSTAGRGASSVQRAIDVFNNGSAKPQVQSAQIQDLPVADANNITPGDISALIPKSTESKEISLDGGQDKLSEATESTESVDTAKVDETQEEPLSKQYAILARKEKAFRAQKMQLEQSIKAREDAVAAKEAELQGKSSSFDESKYIPRDRLKDDLMGVLAESGVSYDDITNAVLNQPKRDPYMDSVIGELKKEIQALKGDLEGTKKSSVEQQQQAYQSAVAQIKRDATNLVNKDPAYETVRETGQVDEVVKLIEKTYHATGEVISIEEACQQVEEELLERFMSTAQKVKKIQERLQPKASAKPEAVKQQESAPVQQQQPMKTLTNSVGSQRKMTNVERAIAVFKGEKI